MEYQNIFKYFAKFPDKTAVKKHLNRSASDLNDYSGLVAFIEALPDVSLLPDVKGFVFSQNEQAVKDYVTAMDGFFLMVEYGPINSRTGQVARTTDFQISFILGHNNNRRGLNMIEEMLVNDRCLYYAQHIISEMQSDNVEICPNEAIADSDIHITPLEPMALYQCQGVVVSFSKQMNDFL